MKAGTSKVKCWNPWTSDFKTRPDFNSTLDRDLVLCVVESRGGNPRTNSCGAVTAVARYALVTVGHMTPGHVLRCGSVRHVHRYCPRFITP